ncbi:hypothetical protein IIA29_07105 [candidate division KSB1 bacterium]|nr:hypothetical protein [candidate division KSB1 bacterium]
MVHSHASKPTVLPGAMLALAESDHDSISSVAEYKQIQACPCCSRIYTYIGEFITNRQMLSSYYEQHPICHCPRTDMDGVAFFLQFMSGALSKDVKLPIIKHINNCYACFDRFVNNWTHYLKIKARLHEEQGSSHDAI